MTIQVRVIGRQAIAQLNQVQQAAAGVGAGSPNTGKHITGFIEFLNSSKFSRGIQRLNYFGRQMTFTATLPFLYLAKSLTRANFAIESSMNRVVKVYGDLSFSQQRINEETEALGKSFELLSTRFGVHQEEVIDIAAAWASAGSAGRGLAENTKLTLQAMILGELEATEATEGLIAIQAQWGLSTVKNAQGMSEMSLALAQLNIIENQTGVTMQGLIESLQRSSGAARVSGMSFVELAAMTAALVPAAGTAANAGNALKTIIASLQAPTQEVIDTFKLMGIEVNSPEWLGTSVTGKIEQVAEKFDDLSTANQAFVSEVLGGKWQISRFSILMQDLNNEMGYYNKAIKAAGGSTKDLTDQFDRELLTVLQSNPKKWGIMTNAIRNTMANAFIPLIPVIMSVLNAFMQLSNWFAGLDPKTQTWIIMGAALFALIGPIAQITSAFMNLGLMIYGLSRPFGWLMSSVLVPMIKQIGVTLMGWVTSIVGTIGTLPIAVGTSTAASASAATASTAAVAGAATAHTGYVLTNVRVMSAASQAASTSMMLGAQAALAASTATSSGAAAAALGSQLAIGTGSTALATTQIINTTAVEVAAVQSAGVITAANTGAAATTAGVWTRAFTYIRGAFMRFLVAPIVSAVTALAATLGLPVWAVVAAIAAVIAAIVLILRTDLEENIWDVIKSIGRAFQALPQVIVNVFNSIIQIIGKAILIIRDALSYLNPFARHSPSLVDNVKAGVAVILDEYKKFQQIPALIRSAVAALDTFGQVAAPGMKSAREAELSDIKSKIGKYDAPAADAAGGVITQVLALEAELPGLAAEIDKQKQVVREWAAALKTADAALNAAEARLNKAQAEFEAVGDAIQAAKDRIDDLSSMKITGMTAMEDQIFANSMAQKQLNLQLLEYERRGEGLDDVREKYAALNGEIELLQGERNTLRLGGAGSDILSVYDDQVNAIKEQQGALADTQDEIKAIQDQLDALDLEGRWLELTQSITFDPLLREIDKLVNGVDEMAFDDIVAGIQEQQALIAQLQPQYDALADTVEREKAAVEEARAIRDGIAAQLDLEEEKLNSLEEAYSSIESLIRDMVSAMSDYATELERAASVKAAEGPGLFETGVNSNFEIPGGDSIIGPEGTLFDIEAFNKEMEAELQAAIEQMGAFDIFAGIREQWDKIVGWFKDNGWKLGAAIVAALTVWIWGIPGLIAVGVAALGAVLVKYAGPIWDWTNDNIVQPIWRALQGIGSAISGVWTTYIWPVLSVMINVIKTVLVTAFQIAWGVISTIVRVASSIISGAITVITTVFGWLMTGVSWLVTAFQTFWAIVSPVLSFFWTLITTIFTAVAAIITGVIIPILTMLWNFWSAVFMEGIMPLLSTFWDLMVVVFESVVEIIETWAVPVFEMLLAIGEIVFVSIGRVLQAFWDIAVIVFEAVWDFITTKLGPAMSWLWNEVAKPVWDGIAKAIGVAWDVMSLIFEGIWNFINDELGPIFTWLGDEVVGPIWEGITNAIDFAWDTISGIFNSIKSGIENVLAPAFEYVLEQVVKPIFKGMIYVIGWAWDKIATIIEGGVNFLGDAFNMIANVINKIGDFLNIDVNISTVGDVSLPRLAYDVDIPDVGGIGGSGGNGGAAKFMASGGVVPADGGRFNQARAIIGEGSKVWPEFVIPTDPRYRGRAHSLLGDLHSRIGGSMVPTYAQGGVVGRKGMSEIEDANLARNEIGGWGPVGWAFNKGKDLVGAAAGFARDKALSALWTPVKAGANALVNQIGMPFIHNIGKGLIGTIDDWVNGGDSAIADKIAKLPQPTKGAGSWEVIPEMLDLMKIPYRILSTLRPGAVTRFSGSPSWHAMDRAIDLAGPTWLNHPQMLNIANAIYDAYKPKLHELIYGGAGAKNVYEGQDHQYGQFLLNEHKNHVHASLRKGGLLVPRSSGGTLLRVGEGMYDEKVQVLPIRPGSDDGGGNNYYFYGDLSFPEVKDGTDAERFLANLEALATPRGMV